MLQLVDVFTLCVWKSVEEWKLMDLNTIVGACQQDVNMQKYVEARLFFIKRYIFKILQVDLGIQSDKILDIISLLLHEKTSILETVNGMQEGLLKIGMKKILLVDILKTLKYVLEFQKWTEDYPSLFELSTSETARVRHFRIYFYLFCGNMDRAKFFVPYMRIPRSVTGNTFSAVHCAIRAFSTFRNFDLGMAILDKIVDEDVQNFDDLERFGVIL